MHLKVYFQDYFKEPLKNHIIFFDWNTIRGNFKKHLREHFKERFMEHFMKHFNEYFANILKYP